MTTVKTSESQKRLLVVWLSLAAPPVLIMIAQSILGKFGERTEEAWGWLLPSITPTLALVLGTCVANALSPPVADRRVDRFYARLATSLSAFYLVLVTVILLASSLTTTPVAKLMESNLYLGPIQGLVGAALGVFFINGAKKQTALPLGLPETGGSEP